MSKQKDRVEISTPKSINDQLEQELIDNIGFYSTQPEAVLSMRIDELEREWYMDRVLITNAASLSAIGILLGVAVDKKWLAMPAVVAVFLLQHGLQGWCPPLPIFRKLGVRSFKEIDRERFALKFLRGDYSKFVNLANKINPEQLYHAVSK